LKERNGQAAPHRLRRKQRIVRNLKGSEPRRILPKTPQPATPHPPRSAPKVFLLLFLQKKKILSGSFLKKRTKRLLSVGGSRSRWRGF
jgi:hypothetical protein